MPNLQRTEKFCSGCNQTLPIESFYKSKKYGWVSRCKSCSNKSRNKYHRVQIEKDPVGYRAKRAEQSRKNRMLNPRTNEQRRKEWLKSLYGMTPEDYSNLFNSQNGVCAICSQPCKTKKGLAVDHNHTTGKIRGLLCANCNGAIGMLQEDPDIIEKAKQYIIKGNNA
jgi:hypothetical protein